MAGATVLSFLEQHNRPFSLNDIQGGIKEDIGKSAVQKALDKLVEEEKVVEKLYGKQKVYFLKQSTETSSNDLKEKLLIIDRDTNELTHNLKEVNDKINVNSKLVSKNDTKMSLGDALERKVQLDLELEEIDNQLDKYSGVEAVDSKKKKKVEQDYEKVLKEYRKRKRMCLDVMEAILENYPKSKAHLIEDAGIETDEAVGFSLEM